MITMDKKYRARDGRDVVLYCVDAPGKWPVHGRVDGMEIEAYTWTANGRFSDRAGLPFDLIEVQSESWWAFELRNTGPHWLPILMRMHDDPYHSEEAARKAHPDAAVIVKVPG